MRTGHGGVPTSIRLRVVAAPLKVCDSRDGGGLGCSATLFPSDPIGCAFFVEAEMREFAIFCVQTANVAVSVMIEKIKIDTREQTASKYICPLNVQISVELFLPHFFLLPDRLGTNF